MSFWGRKTGTAFAFVWLCLNAQAVGLDGNSKYETYAPDGVPFCIAAEEWDVDGLGNHRAVVKLTDEPLGQIARADLQWRRADLFVDKTAVVVIAARSGQKVKYAWKGEYSQDRGVVWFQSVQGEDTYYIYYMPFPKRQGCGDDRYVPGQVCYTIYDAEEAESWKKQAEDTNSKEPQVCQVLRYESRSQFQFLTQMGSIATAEEEHAIRERHPENPILFTEDRAFPISLTHHLPVRWVKKEVQDAFEGDALRNEYYCWQIGLWAAHKDVKNVRLRFSDLRQEGGSASISSDSITCFNQEGTGWNGAKLNFQVNVPQNDIQALWCGMQIPKDCPSGTYRGTATLTADGVKERPVSLVFHVHDEVLADKGDNDLWRMSRLRWLNSSIGNDDKVVAPYEPMKLSGKRIQATEKTIKLASTGLPASIRVAGNEVLSRPMSVEVETTEGTIVFRNGKLTEQQPDEGLVTWISESSAQGLKLQCEARMEFDGYVHFFLRLSSERTFPVTDIRLVTEYNETSQQYMMGCGVDGGLRPKSLEWNWEGPFDSYWMGNTQAGLHTEFRGGTYHGPLLNDYKPAPPAPWYNEGKGRIRVNGTNEARVEASIGATTLRPEPTELEFALNITPVKPVDTKKQFQMHFFHGDYKAIEDHAKMGCNVSNIHHATDLNPIINYPFVIQEPLKAHIRKEHAAGRKVKLYYTIRELTNYVTEIHALKSLNGEIMQPGPGCGDPWLCEHLIDNYRPAWWTDTSVGLFDAAFASSPQSRWINYYLEGMRWMLENYDLDGIYMDDVSFDRYVMKRMRKIMERHKKGCLIDLHSNTGYSRGPMNQYTDFFPYVDRLWFGESFRYNQMKPDEWFVTFSGIPFGPMSEMLQEPTNKWLGTVYGATTRGGSAYDIWPVWDSFDIANSQMLGYWDEKCPVSIDDPDVKATVYVNKNGDALVAVGNFSEEAKDVSLNIRYKALKKNRTKVSLYMPAVNNFQQEQTLRDGQSLHLEGKKGVMILIK